jgi:hypothetical protein
VIAPRDYIAPRPLPDSVLVRLDGREDVTRRRFVRAVRLLGGNPDSLTPAARDRFLDLVIQQRLLAARATRPPRAWDRRDSLDYRVERDNILLRAALSDEFSRIEARRRALGQPDLDEEAMGIAARETLIRELHPVYDEELLRKIGSYFAELPETTPQMSPQEQMRVAGLVPKVPAADTLKVLARSRLGEFTVADLLGDWRRLSSIYRPRITDNEQLRAVVANSLFERSMRQSAERPEVAMRPEVAAVIADRIEYHAVSQYLSHEVVGDIPVDSVTLRRYFDAHRSDFDRAARCELVLLTLETEHAADSLAVALRLPGHADSLVAMGRRAGVHYTHIVTAQIDSALFARAMATGLGHVAGPYKVEGGWQLFEVHTVEPRTPSEFSTVRPQLERAWTEAESERRVKELLDGLEHHARIEKNDRALRALVLSPARRAP